MTYRQDWNWKDISERIGVSADRIRRVIDPEYAEHRRAVSREAKKRHLVKMRKLAAEEGIVK